MFVRTSVFIFHFCCFCCCCCWWYWCCRCGQHNTHNRHTISAFALIQTRMNSVLQRLSCLSHRSFASAVKYKYFLPTLNTTNQLLTRPHYIRSELKQFLSKMSTASVVKPKVVFVLGAPGEWEKWWRIGTKSGQMSKFLFLLLNGGVFVVVDDSTNQARVSISAIYARYYITHELTVLRAIPVVLCFRFRQRYTVRQNRRPVPLCASISRRFITSRAQSSRIWACSDDWRIH